MLIKLQPQQVKIINQVSCYVHVQEREVVFRTSFGSVSRKLCLFCTKPAPCTSCMLTQTQCTVFNNIISLLTAIGLSPGGSGYFTCVKNMKLVTTKFKSGGLHEKHVVTTWNFGNHLSFCL